MRIIAGEFRSRTLLAPAGMDTRPTSDRLRETLFNVLQPRMAGARFLDLYAGSGANGLEAVSRGAREAVLVERAAPALQAIRANVAALGVAGRVRVEGLAVQRWLVGAARAAEQEGVAERGSSQGAGAFDVIFLDPPYADGEAYAFTLRWLGGAGAALLAEGGVVAAEHLRVRRGRGQTPPSVVLAEEYGGLHRTRLLEQGDAALSFYAAT